MGTNVRRPMIHKIPPNLILRPPGGRQNLRLGRDPIEIAEPCYPHDKIVDSHLCGECKKLIWPIVCGRHVSITCRSLKFVDGPQNVRSTNSCQIQAFQDIF